MLLDRVLTEAATGSGTGDITWTVAPNQYALPPAGISSQVSYTLLDEAGAAWEVGHATLTESGGTYTLTRGGAQSVTASSNANSQVTLTTSSAHTLFLTPNAPDLRAADPRIATPVIAAGALAIDLSLGNYFEVSHNANITSITFSNVPTYGLVGVILTLVQDSPGGRSIVWPASVDFSAGGEEPEIDTTADSANVFGLITSNAGTLWRGFLAGGGMA